MTILPFDFYFVLFSAFKTVPASSSAVSRNVFFNFYTLALRVRAIKLKTFEWNKDSCVIKPQPVVLAAP